MALTTCKKKCFTGSVVTNNKANACRAAGDPIDISNECLNFGAAADLYVLKTGPRHHPCA